MTARGLSSLAARLAAALCLAALAWGLNVLDPAEGHAVAVRPWLPWLCLGAVAGTLLAFAGVERRSPADGPPGPLPETAPALAGAAAAFALLAAGDRTVFALAPAALVLPLLARRLRPFGRLASGLHALAAALVALPLLAVLPQLPVDVEGLATAAAGPPAAEALRWLGHPGSWFDGAAVLFSGRAVTVDPLKAGLPFLLLLALADLLYLVALAPARSPALRARLAGSFLAPWTAAVGLLLWHVCTLPDELFAIPDTAVALAWHAPLAAGLGAQLLLLLALGSAPPEGRLRLLPARLPGAGPGFGRLALAGLLAAGAALSWRWLGVLDVRPVTVLVDEVHGRWEPFYGTWGRADQDPTFSPNNYRSFLRWLTRFADVRLALPPDVTPPADLEPGCRVERRTGLGAWLLEGSPAETVLVLKCATRPFEPGEPEAVEAFVRAGGRLVLIGDHTDAMLMNTNLNPVARRFGVTFRADSTYSLGGAWLATSARCFTHHPAARGRGDFYWANGCTLNLVPPAQPLLCAPWVAFAEPARYHEQNFFGDKVLNPSDRLGRSVIEATAEVGAGRVWAFTDSTCFNNELFFTHGRRELWTAVLRWFGARGAPLPPAVPATLGLLALVALAPARRPPGAALRALLTVLPLALVAGVLAADGLAALAMPEPRPLRPLPPRTLVDASHDPRPGVIFEGRARFTDDSPSLLPLFEDLGRLPWFPEALRRTPLTGAGLAGARLLIVAGPRRPFTPDEQEAVLGFVRAGSGLLLLEGAGSNGAINSLARRFGMEVQTGDFRFAAGSSLLNPAPVMGGTALAGHAGFTVAAFAREGSGLACCLADDWWLSDGNERRVELGLGSLFHDLARALAEGDETALRSLAGRLAHAAGR